MKRARRNVNRKAAPEYMASIHSLISGFQVGGMLTHGSKRQSVAEIRGDLLRFLGDDEFWNALEALEQAANRIKAGGLAE